MRILHITSNLEIGGAQRVRLELLRKLIAIDHEPKNHMLAYFIDGPMREKFENIGVKTVQISGEFFTYGPASLKFLRKVIKEFKPDIIHSQLWAANIFARLAALNTNIPVICDLHNMPEVQGFWRNLFEHLFLIKPTRYVAVSDGIAKAYMQKFGLKEFNQKSAVAGSVVTIKNGVDANKFRFSFAARENLRETFDIDSDYFVIGAVGRLESVKSFDNLIQAFAMFYEQIKQRLIAKNLHEEPLVRLVIVGDGSQKQMLRGLAKSHNLGKKIIITTPTKSISRFYSLFDCLAISSRSEGLSVALLEALFAGLKVITTSPSNMHEVVVQDKNGYIVSFNDQAAMVKIFMELFENFNPDFLERPSLASSDFEILNMSKSYQALYRQILQEVKSK